ncbi:DUF1365 domain-containing protein [Nakamurella silvestris]|nr:DUF1365 domain-containing protein [Nakamurella silvestris]
MRHVFAYRSPMWLVDLDHVPVLPRGFGVIGSIDSRDHWDGSGTIRGNVDAFLAARGARPAAKVLMLAGARSFGHCFNPISIYWCYDAEGNQQDIVVEVHNTYHGRHAYLLEADEAGRATVEKAFYVSPFMEGHGQYRMRITAPERRLDVLISLEQNGSVPFTAAMHGTARPGGRWNFLTRPFAQLRVSALIRWQGITLWRRKLAVQPRSGPGITPVYVNGNLRHTAPSAADTTRTGPVGGSPDRSSTEPAPSLEHPKAVAS